jgi:hypothetical protein
MKNNSFKHAKATERENRKEQGFFDGRFKPKVQQTKKNKTKYRIDKNSNFDDDL